MLFEIIAREKMQLQIKPFKKIQTKKGTKYMEVELLYLSNKPAPFSTFFFSKMN